jgi:hypothetical protein
LDEDVAVVKMIGYWITSFDDRDFIAPQELVGDYPAEVRARIVEYLQGGRLLEAYFGLGACRFPRCEYAATGIGSREFTDGVWAWPEGLFHYIAKHNVTLPAEFVAHATESPITPRTYDYSPSRYSCGRPDNTFWMDWCARNGSGTVRRKIAGLQEEAGRALARAKSRAHASFEVKCLYLKIRRGVSSERCHWKRCESRALNGKAYCVRHCEEGDMERNLLFAQDLILRQYLDRCLADAEPRSFRSFFRGIE